MNGLAAGIAEVLVGLGLLTLSGCSLLDGGSSRPAPGPTELGWPCEIWVAPESAGSSESTEVTVVLATSDDCASQICLKQAGYRCPDGAASCATDLREPAAPVCSQECASRDDCAWADGTGGCSTYVCQAFGDETGWPGRCGCVCLDLVRDLDDQSVTLASFQDPDARLGVCPAAGDEAGAP